MFDITLLPLFIFFGFIAVSSYGFYKHATKHTDGSDDIQTADAAQKGLMSKTHHTNLVNVQSEVVTARGSKASLDERLDVELNEDGSSKAKGSKANLNEFLDVEHNEDGTHQWATESIVKAWIQFNGTGTIAIQDSFNVSSIADNGVGKYTVNWDTDFANDDYAIAGIAERVVGVSIMATDFNTFLVGSVNVEVFRVDTQAPYDSATITAIAIGDQS